VALGPLAGLAWTPRITVDGFVVAPQSWRLPEGAAASARALAAWRRLQPGLPRWVQAGHEDELLPVDLGDPEAHRDLAGQDCVFEVWPPPGDTVDRAGRRLEAVVALVDEPDPDERAARTAAIAATAAAGQVAPPRRQHAGAATSAGGAGEAAPAAPERWHTFKLFGAADRLDALLLDAAHPAVTAALAAREIAGWFFLRYVDGPGRRHHLRLRVRGDVDRFAARLCELAAVAREDGDLVALERAGYFPESARFGGPEAMPAVHDLFQAESELACTLLLAAAEAPGDESAGDDDARIPLLVCAFDALCEGMGVDARARRQLALSRRAAHAPDVTPALGESLDAGFRAAGRGLRAALAAGGPPELRVMLKVHRRRVSRAAAPLDGEARMRVLPSLLHLQAVRVLGADLAGEIRAYTFWERALDGLERHRPGSA
jgi:lantibiotic biosynthesis protein